MDPAHPQDAPQDAPQASQGDVLRVIGGANGDVLGVRRPGLSAYAGTFGVELLIRGCTIIQALLVANFLPPEQRGELAAVILWPTLISSLLLLGVDVSASRRVAKGDDIGVNVRTTLMLTVILSMLGVLIGWALLPQLLPPEYRAYTWLARVYLIFVPINQGAAVLRLIDQGQGNFRRFNIVRSIINPGMIVGVLLGAILGRVTVPWVVGTYLVAQSVPFVVRLVWTAGWLRGRVSLRHAAVLLKEGMGFAVMRIVTVLYFHLDKILIMWMLVREKLGLYALAFSAASLLSAITQSAGMIAFTRSAQSPFRQGFHQIAQAFRVIAWAAIFGGALLAALLPVAIPLVVPKYAAAAPIAAALVAGMVLAGLADFVDQCLQGHGRPMVSTIGRTIYMAVMLAAGLPLLYAMGLMGFVIAFIIAQAIYLLWLILNLVRGLDNASFAEMVHLRFGDLRFAADKFRRAIKRGLPR